jgi:conjugative transposon TraN protein
MRHFLILSFLIPLMTSAQQHLVKSRLKITDNKSTFLSFDSPVELHDIGSDDVVLKTTEKLNVVKLKGRPSFKETNLTLTTANGQYYSFLLNYSPNPDTLIYFFTSPLTAKQSEIKQELQDNRQEKTRDSVNLFQNNSKKVLDHTRTLPPVGGRVKYKVGLILKGIYVSEQKMYFQVSVFNQSALAYDIDFIKFNVKSKRGLKKATIQEVELQPLYIFGANITTVSPADHQVNFVYVFDKFTLTNSKTLSIELWEKNGERSVSFEVNSNDLLKAISL